MKKIWKLREKVPSEMAEKFPEYDGILLQLLYNRGLTDESRIEAFVKPDFLRDVHDPFSFKDMKRSVDRIIRAVRRHERIVVYGDYDADGVCASAILSETLSALGARVEVYIPFRDKEGYGMNVGAIEELANRGCTLIITVDCGTANAREVERARELGIDTIVTDHHDEPPVLPRSYALINPELKRETYPFRHLSAAGVAFKLASALFRETSYGAMFGRNPLPQGWEKWLLDLVGIATVTDMVPVLDENRVFVCFGLDVLRKSRRPGIRELFKTLRTPLDLADEDTVAFQVGPRLNAAGRMNHASQAYQLLITSDVHEASLLAEKLFQANSQRQRLTEEIVEQALSQIGEDKQQWLVWAFGETWPVGILGLVASRIAEHLHRPTVIMSRPARVIVGSGRSIPGFDITAALRLAKDQLDRFGGHPQACGFTLAHNVSAESFANELAAIAQQKLKGLDLTETLMIDSEVVLDDIDWELVEDVQRLKPFGVDAPRPTFVSRGLSVVSVDTVGKGGKHLRLDVSHATSTVRKTIGFRFGSWVDTLRSGDSVDMVFEVGVNEWNGTREIELKIVDLDHSRTRQRVTSSYG